MDLRDALDDAERQELERLALADWSEAAEARVDPLIVLGRRAAVNLLLTGDYEILRPLRAGRTGALVRGCVL